MYVYVRINIRVYVLLLVCSAYLNYMYVYTYICTENDQAQSCRELVTIDTHRCIEVMLAPCPATDILDILMERKSLAAVRQELQRVIHGASRMQTDLSASSIIPDAKKVLNKLVFSPSVDRVRNRMYMMYLFCVVGKLVREGAETPIGAYEICTYIHV